MTNITQNTTTTLVVNWHITEVCNYACRYCFGKWEKDSRELIHSSSDTRLLLNRIAGYFQQANSSKQLGDCRVDERIRLNIAGGEPFLYRKRFKEIAVLSQELDMSLSCITNGSKLNHESILEFSPLLRVLGISVDSACMHTNIATGRSSSKGVLDLGYLCEMVDLARRINPHLQVKINTVVSSANWTSDLSEFITCLSPDRWKVFKVLPTLNNQLAIGDIEYMSFVKRHQHLKDIMTVENNEAMTQSYLMIDPLGRFYQNRESSSGYDYSDPILKVGIEVALNQISFNAERFHSRY